MRKLIATIVATLALAGVGLATHAATSNDLADASVTQTSYQANGGWQYLLLPYIEQDNVYKMV